MRSDCPVSYSLDFFGDKWTLLIIRDLVFDCKRFYKDFQQSKEGIATNILSDRLKKLEANGVIQSRVFPELKTKKEYTLTEKGKDLIPVLVEMILWSAKYRHDLAVTEEFIQKASTDRASVIAFLRGRLE
ncbi:MAG: helix-turn-helix transcriptional regulator [Leptolyngbya sp. SIO3F4]|nr:helix-turn-helix transcriptional regulator [Leptolyngbya sp. SIO3F4]